MEVGNLRIRIEITSSRNLAWSVSKRSLVTHTLYNDRKSNNSTSLKRIMAMPWTKKKVHYSGIRPASSHTKIHGRFACAQCMRLAGIELSRPCGSLQWLSSFNPRQGQLVMGNASLSNNGLGPSPIINTVMGRMLHKMAFLAYGESPIWR